MAGRSGVDDETPRGRLLSRGAQSLSDAELLSILLRTNNGTSRELLDEIGGFQQLATIEATKLHGRTNARSATLLAAVEFACRLAREQVPERVLLCRLGTTVKYLRLRYEKAD